jgi:hypothetical protein
MVSVEGWRAIDGRELDRGRGKQRPRIKLSQHDELLAATGAPSGASPSA